MIKILLIFLLLPCFLKAQTTASDTTYADTTTRLVYLPKAGAQTFDTITVANNSTQGYTYIVKGENDTMRIAKVDVWVRNLNGKYSILNALTIPGNYSFGFPVGSVFEIVVVNNMVIARYRTNKSSIIKWSMIKTKIKS